MPKLTEQERDVRQQIWAWLCVEIIWRSDAFEKWEKRNRRLWDVEHTFDPPSHRGGRSVGDPKFSAVNAFLNTVAGRRAADALRMFRFWEDEKPGTRGFGITGLIQHTNGSEDDCLDVYPKDVAYHKSAIGRMLGAYDMHSCGLGVMEITRYFFRETEGLNPSYDETADRSRQQVQRWIDAIARLVGQVDNSK